MQLPIDLTPDEIALLEQQANELLYQRARDDFNIFAELVMVDDETGDPIKQAPIHRRWAQLCEEHDRLLIWSHINSGKTTQLSIMRTVWELGRDVTLRFVILSNTSSIATKIVKAIAHLIKNNETVKKIFPHLAPDPEGPWTTTELKVKRPNSAKDPSVRAVGVHGSLTSGRVDRLIVDDILDPENVETEQSRKKLESWYKAVAVGRLTRRAKILVVGTAYHPRDLLHTVAKQKGWKWVRFPVITSTGKVAWPEFWPSSRIERMREELGPAEFARQLLCKARDDDEARFKQEWIDEALRKGEGRGLVHSLESVPEGCTTFTGVDLAVSKRKKADQTVFFTFMEDSKGNRTVLNIEAGKYTGPEIVDKIIDSHKRYHSVIAVENVAAQDFILQFARDISNVPVVPFTTSRAKWNPVYGVEGLAIELANGKWVIPNSASRPAPEVETWITEMLFYSPQTHTGDRLMACYFAREIAKKMIGNVDLPTIEMRVLGAEGGNGISVSNDNGGASPLSGLFDVPSGQPSKAA